MDHRDDAVRLALPDGLLLLALDDERGTRAHSTELEPGLAGAVLVDLALRGRLDADGKILHVVDPSPTGDAVLDTALATIARESRPRTAQHWVGKLQKGVRQEVSDRLVAAGTLRRDEKKVLWVFPVTRLPAGNPAPETAVRARLDDAVLRGVTPDERTAALAALVHATGLGRAVFPEADRRAVTTRLAELSEGQWAAEAVRRAVQATAAATAAVIMAARITTTGGT